MSASREVEQSLQERKGFKSQDEPTTLSSAQCKNTKTTPSTKDTEHPIKASEKTNRVPGERPPFTIGDLKRAIPKHCFERSLLKSSAYLVVDLSIIAALFYSTTFYSHPSLPYFAPYILWPVYWLLQGYVFTGLWVIAHECGHGAFSPYEFINDTIGWVCHSFLLVPYFSWKISHAGHHSKTANIDSDAVFVPHVKKDHHEELPSVFLTLARVFITLFLGWFLYLGWNKTGSHKPEEPLPNHFNPYSPLFAPKDRHLIVLSDIGLLICLGVLAYLGYQYSFLWLAKVFIVPYLHVNFWLVLITQLQHTDLKLPHFRSEDWNWLQGALCTVDRDYGFLNVVFHHIGDTHVAHHLFSKMPHYHAQEATKAIIPLLGKYYCKDDTPLWKAMWTSTHYCQEVIDVPGEKALWY